MIGILEWRAGFGGQATAYFGYSYFHSVEIPDIVLAGAIGLCTVWEYGLDTFAEFWYMV
jgi:hypothetical protein